MKNLNFSTKSGSQSGSHRVVTLASTVGSPSAHRRGAMLKLLSVLAIILTIGVGQMWANYTITFNGSASESTAISTSTTAASITGSSSYVTGNVATATKAYGATSGGIKLGTGSASGTIKVNLSSSGQVTPKKILVNCKLYNSSKAATLGVNGSTKQSIGSDYDNLSFTITSAITYIQLDVTKYAWVKYVRVVDCDAPTAVAKGSVTSSSVPLTITDASNVGTYEVYYSTSNTAPNDGTTASTTVTTKTPTITDLEANTTYYLWVRSKCSNTSKSDWCALTGGSFTTTSAAPSYTITALSNSTDYGTVSLSGSVITGAPKSGYRYASPAYSVSPANSATVSQSGNAFTVTPSANTTVTINFEPIPTHKISFNTGGLVDIADATGIQEGAVYNITQTPAASLTPSCEYGTFVGWTNSSSIANPSVKPALVSSVTMSTSDVTLYAVYSKTVGGGGNNGSIELTIETENFPTAYGTANTFTEYTLEGKKFKIQQGYVNGTKLQWRASGNSNGTGIIYNTEVFPAKITSVVLVYDNSDTNKNFTLNVGDTENPTSGTAITPSSEGNTYTFDCSEENADYFVLANGSGAGYLTSITINYGSNGTTSYSLDANCCTPLGQINGSISLSQKSATLSWDLDDAQNGGKDHINSWKVEYKLSSADDWTVAESELAKATLTKTISDLNCNTDYDFRVSANVQNGYCDIVKEWTSQKTTKFTITKDETGGGGITLSPTATSVCDGDVIDVIANTPDGSHEGTGTIKVVETGSDPENDVTSTVYNSGTGKLTMPAYNITISATYTEKSSPSVGVSVAALNFGTPKKDASVAAQTFNLTGSALTVGTLTLVAPSGFTVSPSSITIASAGNLSATEITVTPNTGTAGNFDGNISISGAGVSSTNIVALTMTVLETYTVKWYVNGTKIEANSKTDVTGTAVSAPSDFSAFTDCQDLTFVGWKEGSAIDGGSTTEAPSLAEVVTTIPAANKDYYAVFAEGIPGSAQWEKATSVAAGEYLIVYETGGVVFDGSLSTLDAVGNTIAVTINDSKIAYSNATEAAKFTIAAKTGGYSIKSASNLYIGQTSNANGLKQSETDEYTNTISISDGNADIVCSSAHLRYNSASNQTRFRYFQSSSYSNQQAIQLYKKNVSPANFTKWYTTCPQCSKVTLQKVIAGEGAEAAGNAIAFSPASTTVKTCEAAEVTVSPTIATGWELTSVVPTGVPGVTYDAGVISIPQGKEGTLNVTATFAQKNYSIAVETYPAEIGADLTGATSTAKYGVEQTISTNEPTGYLFGGWYMYDAEDTEKETDLSSELFTGIYEGGDLELSASFLMPDKNLVAEAYFDKIYTPAEALALDDLTDSVYVEGVISQVDEVSTQYKNATYWISADGTTTNQIKIYRGKHINKADVTVDNAAQIAVGNKVRVRGKLSQSSNVNQFGQGASYITVLVEKTLSALTIVGDASVTTYDVGDSFDKTGLSLSATYNTGYVQANYTGTTITSDYDAPTTFTTGVTKVTVSAVEGLISTSRDIPVTVSSAVLDRVEISAAAQTEFWAKEQYKEPLLDAYLTDEPATILHNVTGESNTTGLNMSEPGNKSVSVTYTRKAGQSDDVEYNFTVKPVVVDEAHAHSVATAREIIDVDETDGENLDLALNDTKTHVVGVVTSVNALTGGNGKYTIVIKDQTDADKVMTLYQVTLKDGITSVEVGDVIKAYGNLYWYAGGSKYEINEGGQVVWKQPKVSITIANKTLEVGEVWTIAATIDPAAAPVTYSIKDGSDDCVTLATNVITATAEGTATIIASAEAYDDGVNTYAANSKEFTITVNPAAVHTNVVLLAEYNGTYYALKNDASTVTVEMNGGMVVVANEATKNAIIWDRAEREGVATFKNGDNYLNANGSNDMTVSDTEVSWNWNSTYYRKGTDVRTFLYQAGNVNKIKYYAVSNAGNANYSNLPIIYTGKVAIKIAPIGDDPVTKDEDDVPSNASIVVSNKVTLEINNAKTLDNLTVEAGGTVSGSAALSVNDLTIKTNSGAFAVTGTSGQLTGSVMPVVSGDLFIEIKLCEGAMDAEASRKWYCISAPFNVNMNGGFFWGDGTQMVLNTDFQLFEWDGDRRATGISGWKRVSGVMKAGIAYFIGFDDERSNQNTIKLKAMSNTISNADKIVAPTHTGSAEAATYGNWNGMANPNFHHIALNKNVQAFDYDKQGYSPYATGDYNFVVGTPFFIQYAGDIAIEDLNDGKPFRAPKREGELYSYCVRIGSVNKTVADNQIYVRASETASAEYDSEREMITLNGTTSNYGALLWTVNYGGKRLAIEEAPLVNDKASYALSLYAPADGAYRIETPTVREDASLYLTYEGNIIWDLSAGAYELDLNKGATEGYGLMLVRKVPQVTTGVETIDNSQSTIHNCQKVILNDHVYILRDAQLYDVTGKAVK